MKKHVTKPKSLLSTFALMGALCMNVLLLVLPVRAAVGLSFGVAPNSFAPRSTALELGTPTVAQTVNLKAQYASAPGDGTVVTISVSSQCLVADYAKGGFGSAGSSAATTFNAYNDSFSVYIWGVDDTKYEGNHSCTATVTTASSNPEANGVTASTTIAIEDNDTAPAPSPSPSTRRTTTPTPSPAATTNAAAPPAIPVESVKINDQAGTAAGGETPSFNEKEPVALSGTTIPNGKVKLYIFSEPRTAEITADAQGNWRYTIEDLEPGDHRVEAEVTDPATGKTSPKVELAKFAVKDATHDANTAPASERSPQSKLPFIIGGFVGLAALGVGGFFGYRWWKKKKIPPVSAPDLPRPDNGTFSAEDKPKQSR